jgi:HPt (histidine-containing phosphotransfer) domain-containing protein
MREKPGDNMSISARKTVPPRRTAIGASNAKGVPPVDLARLRRFTLGNVELEREIIGLFATQAPVMMDALAQARTEQAWREATHTLKGSSGSIGAWLVAEAAARAEGAVDNTAKWAAARREIAEAMHTSLSYLADVQADLGAAEAAE